jgi:hypothetical protein
MSRILDPLVANAAYAFIAVGVVWLAVAILAGSALILWPVVACVAGGVMLKQWPGQRITWAWVISASAMGFLLSAYQVYAWMSFLGGAFSGLAAASLAGFAVLALVHLFLFYLGTAKPGVAEAISS